MECQTTYALTYHVLWHLGDKPRLPLYSVLAGNTIKVEAHRAYGDGARPREMAPISTAPSGLDSRLALAPPEGTRAEGEEILFGALARWHCLPEEASNTRQSDGTHGSDGRRCPWRAGMSPGKVSGGGKKKMKKRTNVKCPQSHFYGVTRGMARCVLAASQGRQEQ